MSDQNTISELREVNRLVYLRPSNESLINSRTNKEYNFTNAEYSMGASPQAIINSGGDFLYGPTSYLRTTLTLAGGAHFGSGSVMNIFKNIRITARSGEVLEFVQNANVLAKIKANYMTSSSGNVVLEDLISVPQVNGTYTKCIPLYLLLGVFAENEAYIPGGFLAGAKIEIDLATTDEASANGGAITNIQFQIVLDSAQVYDSVQKQLLEEQANVDGAGLQFTYSTYFNSGNFTSSDSISFDVQQSASITQNAIAVLRNNANIALTGKDSFNFLSNALRYQWRLGSQYFPQKAITCSNALAESQVEPYYNAMVAVNALPHQWMGSTASSMGSSVSLENYVGGSISAAETDGYAVYATTLEKSATGLMLSGEPTNNSRILNLEMTLKTTASVPGPAVPNHRLDVYLQYVRVANIMGDNLVVDR